MLLETLYQTNKQNQTNKQKVSSYHKKIWLELEPRDDVAQTMAYSDI